MNLLARQFFRSGANFSEVRLLSEESAISWESLSEVALDLPRGWYELSQIYAEERIEFTRDFWLSQLPFHPAAHPSFVSFFNRLDDVAVLLLRGKEEPELLHAELIYSLEDNSSFFRGLPPAHAQDIEEFKQEVGILLPRDFLSFLRLHNGFGKLSELEILSIEEIPDGRRRVMELFLQAQEPVKSGEAMVDPGSLVPFYEADGLSSFQCFYSDWYPNSEMGNVFVSGIDQTVSDTRDRKAWAEQLAFASFSEWLAAYLEGMSVSL